MIALRKEAGDMDAKSQAVEPQIPKTVFFEACRGVFQGGGCRAPAHVGAYQAAIAAGVNFSEVAGTSAGSIIAALIGAGASPDFVTEHCAKLNLLDLLSKPENVIKTGFIGRGLRPLTWLPGGHSLLNILSRGAEYSSREIESWVNDRLADLLPTADRPVKFRDLILPTWVVATDLSGSRPKVWSTYDTPEDSVGFAVRSSCSIPLFFEPVRSGNNLYVDGGMLSNLPSFVFSGKKGEDRILGGRVLGFSLAGDDEPPAEWSLIELLKRLLDAAIGGATNLQVAMQPGVNVITINTGRIKATDFDISEKDIDFLIRSGREATFDFIRNEGQRLRETIAAEITSRSQDEFYDYIVREALSPGSRLVISDRDTQWFWKLFPTVAGWCDAGANLDILVLPAVGNAGEVARETQRRGYLAEMGARIKMMDTLPITGFILCRQDEHGEAAFMLNESKSDYGPFGCSYIGRNHRSVINAARRLIDTHLPGNADAHTTISLASAAADEVISRLKQGVWQYAPPKVSISLEEVDVKAVSMIVRRVRSFKYRQIGHLEQLYLKYNIPMFGPANVQRAGKTVSVIAPPVLELWGDQLISLEGNTRILYMRKHCIPKALCLVVRGVEAPLPGIPVEAAHVLLSSRSISSNETISGFNYANFRSIEGSIRPIQL